MNAASSGPRALTLRILRSSPTEGIAPTGRISTLKRPRA